MQSVWFYYADDDEWCLNWLLQLNGQFSLRGSMPVYINLATMGITGFGISNMLDACDKVLHKCVRGYCKSLVGRPRPHHIHLKVSIEGGVLRFQSCNNNS